MSYMGILIFVLTVDPCMCVTMCDKRINNIKSVQWIFETYMKDLHNKNKNKKCVNVSLLPFIGNGY